MAEIKDSGMRREFDTGAVRDICEGKGRCDLLPLDVTGQLMHDPIQTEIEGFKQTHDVLYLYNALHLFAAKCYKSEAEMLLEVSKHFEEAAKKYPPDNWKKGIPISSYINSAVRHLLKWRDGWKDERHDRAFVWNLLAAIWTMKYLPEMDDLPRRTYTLEEVVEELGVELETEKPKRGKTFLEDFISSQPTLYKPDEVYEEFCVICRYPHIVDDFVCPGEGCCEECWNRVMPEWTGESGED